MKINTKAVRRIKDLCKNIKEILVEHFWKGNNLSCLFRDLIEIIIEKEKISTEQFKQRIRSYGNDISLQ